MAAVGAPVQAAGVQRARASWGPKGRASGHPEGLLDGLESAVWWSSFVLVDGQVGVGWWPNWVLAGGRGVPVGGQ